MDFLSVVERILTEAAEDDVWQLQGELLAVGGKGAEKAREVAGEFRGFLRDMESKAASRSGSRWAAVLETASVSSVGLQEMLAERKAALKRLMASGVTGLLEVVATAKNV